MSRDDVFDESQGFHHEKETIECEVEYCNDIEDEYGVPRRGVKVTCSECGHTAESFGQSKKSINRCLALLHEECPNNEDNWYEV